MEVGLSNRGVRSETTLLRKWRGGDIRLAFVRPWRVTLLIRMNTPKTGFIRFGIVSLFLFIQSALAQSGFESGLYRITSGTYTECCGIAGPLRYTLPNASQSFVRLTIDSRDFATMSFLGQDARTVFSRMTCPPAPQIDFSFNYGFLFSDVIFFHVDPGPYGLYWNYAVSNSAGGLRIDGMVGIQLAFCADVPNRFNHTNVMAALIPPPRLSMLEFSK